MIPRRAFLSTSLAAPLLAAQPIRTAFVSTKHSHFSGKWKAVSDNASYSLAGIHEPDPQARARVKAQPRWLSEEELFADKSIALVVVETPIAQALPWARKAIAAGKHVHLEKPPSHEWAPFREVVEEARRRSLLLQTGYIWRFHEGVRRAIEAARNGWLGHVYLMRGTINTDISDAQRRELAPFRGGMMFELGCHQIDRVVDLLGRPKNVKSWLQKTPAGKQDGLADATLAVFEFDSAMAVISTGARMAGASQHRSLEIIGTDGAVILQPVEPGTNMRVTVRTAQGPYKAGWQDVELPPQPRYTGDFADLARAIQTARPLTFSYDFELLVQETILRASQEL
ncbi:MAG: Gfo/Idh/MocA family oxidoreductase [Acidobacteria bacterium]|nr:Gfo/Idh/MocA family oxidoreductase [Acidobacteriota bacterium]